MPAAIDSEIKKQVINQWLSGDSRDGIADDNGIGAGTVREQIPAAGFRPKCSMNHFSAHQNKAIISLIKLQSQIKSTSLEGLS